MHFVQKGYKDRGKSMKACAFCHQLNPYWFSELTFLFKIVGVSGSVQAAVERICTNHWKLQLQAGLRVDWAWLRDWFGVGLDSVCSSIAFWVCLRVGVGV